MEFSTRARVVMESQHSSSPGVEQDQPSWEVLGTSSGLHLTSIPVWDNQRLPKPPCGALRKVLGKVGVGRGSQNTSRLCSTVLCGTPQTRPIFWAPSAVQLQTLGQIPHPEIIVIIPAALTLHLPILPPLDYSLLCSSDEFPSLLITADPWRGL